MRLRNNIFAAAFDYLKRNTDIKTQKDLALRMGVTENTITRILKSLKTLSPSCKPHQAASSTFNGSVEKMPSTCLQ